MKRRDPVETIIILLGGLLVVVIAFFIARGDLDYYTEYLLTGGVFERKIEVKEVEIPFSSYFPEEEEFLPQETPQEMVPSPVPEGEEVSPPRVAATPRPEEKRVEPPRETKTPPTRVAEAPSGEFLFSVEHFLNQRMLKNGGDLERAWLSSCF